MSHQKQLEKSEYRNWVKGGLAYKYLKDGLEGFASEAVEKEHKRILSYVNCKPGLTCSQCDIRTLKPLHKSADDQNAEKNRCPLSQTNCNCLFPKKKPCPNKICDAIFDEVIRCYDYEPPEPNWKNGDIHKWCTCPWEIAKCYIKAPGYQGKTNASEIDVAGLLHIFLSNISLQSSLSCKINGNDVFSRTLKRRNVIFHSPSMELEDSDLNECIDDIITILEDDKELKERQDSRQAVVNLKQLQHEDFCITTNNEIEVCRNALAEISTKAKELRQTIEDANADFIDKQAEASKKTAHDNHKEAVHNSLQTKGAENDCCIQTLKQRVESLNGRVENLETENSFIKKRLVKLEEDLDKLDFAISKQQNQLDYLKHKQEFKAQLKIYTLRAALCRDLDITIKTAEKQY